MDPAHGAAGEDDPAVDEGHQPPDGEKCHLATSDEYYGGLTETAEEEVIDEMEAIVGSITFDE